MITFSGDFFLGANTPCGFYSYFEQSYNTTDQWQIYIIKGGPGTGKSTLMKRICDHAERQGTAFERIWCSSDPSSLDAVILPYERRAIFDGTAPHILEPKLVGACENIINLGDAWDIENLREHTEHIRNLSEICSQHHRQCSKWLACADAFRQNTLLLVEKAIDKEKIDKSAERFCRRVFGSPTKKADNGRTTTRLISAVTPNGVTFAGKTPFNQVVRISDRYGLVADRFLRCIAQFLTRNGEDIILCPCSQNRHLIEHIVVPARDLLVTTTNDIHSVEANSRTIHAERFMDTSLISEYKQRITANRRAQRNFIQLAVNEMSCALQTHNKLEEFYKNAMDYSILDSLSQHCIERFFA